MRTKRSRQRAAARASALTFGKQYMTTVAMFTKPEEAHLFRMRLEAVGFNAFIQDENMVQIDLLASNALGGVRVQVADEDVDSVRDYLQADMGLPSEADQVHCPRCNSTATTTETFSRRFAYLSLLCLGIPLLFKSKSQRCESCLHTWKVSPQGQ